MVPDGRRDVPTPITTPAALAAMTHPLRMRLVGELAARGSARVTDLAAALDEPSNSVSFHIRQLAKHRVIETDPDRATNARERWWRMSSDCGFSVDLTALERSDGGQVAAETFRRVAEGHVVAIHRVIRGRQENTKEAGDATPTISDDFVLRLSSAELRQMRDEFAELIDRWSARSRAVTDSDDSGELDTYYGIVMAAPTRAIIALQFGS